MLFCSDLIDRGAHNSDCKEEDVFAYLFSRKIVYCSLAGKQTMYFG
ncbi:hypothetical protein AZE42_08982 [Rhizopogon vesiculosus]|uniref:Uncharacterized protein n=1 Tax=Rhizopogon vesiculosus TaxID=180088 RepID=A0A1J8PIX2_9AGAM|nr:hypothetical protein AZE42_08982 [Rhizopogon vesiculosus]